MLTIWLMKIKRWNVHQDLYSDLNNEVSVFSNSQTAVSERWFQFNVGKMHTLSTDNLFNL